MGLTEVERILHVVEIADLKIPVDRIELLHGQHHVLHLRPPDPFDPNVERAAGKGFGDHADQLHAVQECGVDLDDQAKDILSVQEDRAGIGERQLARHDRLQRRRCVHDERIPMHACENPHSPRRPIRFLVHTHRHRLARRGAAGALLIEALTAVSTDRSREEAVDDGFRPASNERHRIARRARGERAQTESR